MSDGRGSIFIKVEKWRTFQESNITRNEIYMCGEVEAPVQAFVTNLEQELDYMPGLASDVCCFLDHSFGANESM